ncbi:conserved hypothetical protein [Mesorhizobium prunaredense]|uniref:Uncharacterized protein n=1 Tax=Mesorhizobium prunaredense TaxID=1631249 RepID=A0A1R3V2P7_9HYPH|nr:conserved hypothetical protein [Mesorhizobium prunaredense]
MKNSLDAYGSAFDSVENYITLEGNGAQTGTRGTPPCGASTIRLQRALRAVTKRIAAAGFSA